MAEQITAPGVYNLPAAEYHADPVEGGSLSSSGARLLLPPSCPAAFRYWADHPEKPKDIYDFGHVAHRLVLGRGAEIAEVKADDWRTNLAKKAKADAHAAGLTPILTKDLDRAKAMAAAVREHRWAKFLFDPGYGQPEQTLVYQDPATGVWRRAMLDWLGVKAGSRLVIPDYKTCESAAPDAVQRAIASYGYHLQGDWYVDLVKALGLAEDAVFVLCFQEKDPPHLINLVSPDPVAMRIGRQRNREALERYRDCVESGRWPGYGDEDTEVPWVSLPPWIERQYETESW
jgi:hypothetical protein